MSSQRILQAHIGLLYGRSEVVIYARQHIKQHLKSVNEGFCVFLPGCSVNTRAFHQTCIKFCVTTAWTVSSKWGNGDILCSACAINLCFHTAVYLWCPHGNKDYVAGVDCSPDSKVWRDCIREKWTEETEDRIIQKSIHSAASNYTNKH